ncbi:MAG: hypothetical protein ABI910_07070 [Gemmatimonadota bacterium]
MTPVAGHAPRRRTIVLAALNVSVAAAVASDDVRFLRFRDVLITLCVRGPDARARHETP